EVRHRSLEVFGILDATKDRAFGDIFSHPADTRVEVLPDDTSNLGHLHGVHRRCFEEGLDCRPETTDRNETRQVHSGCNGIQCSLVIAERHHPLEPLTEGVRVSGLEIFSNPVHIPLELIRVLERPQESISFKTVLTGHSREVIKVDLTISLVVSDQDVLTEIIDRTEP